MPRDLEVSFLSSSSLQVNWKKPFFPNGEITRYVVRYQETDSSQFWNVNNNWCTTLDPTNWYGGKTEEKPEGELSASVVFRHTWSKKMKIFAHLLLNAEGNRVEVYTSFHLLALTRLYIYIKET